MAEPQTRLSVADSLAIDTAKTQNRQDITSDIAGIAGKTATTAVDIGIQSSINKQNSQLQAESKELANMQFGDTVEDRRREIAIKERQLAQQQRSYDLEVLQDSYSQRLLAAKDQLLDRIKKRQSSIRNVDMLNQQVNGDEDLRKFFVNNIKTLNGEVAEKKPAPNMADKFTGTMGLL